MFFEFIMQNFVPNLFFYEVNSIFPYSCRFTHHQFAPALNLWYLVLTTYTHICNTWQLFKQITCSMCCSTTNSNAELFLVKNFKQIHVQWYEIISLIEMSCLYLTILWSTWSLSKITNKHLASCYHYLLPEIKEEAKHLRTSLASNTNLNIYI